MNIDEIKAYLEANKANAEVQAFINSFKVAPTLEVFKGLTITDANYKSYMDSEKDQHSAKSLKTWQDNNLQKLVDEKVKELYPAADPKDTELAKMKIMLETMQKDSTRKELTNKALKMAQEKKLPIELIDFLIGNDEDSTVKNIDSLNKIFLAHDEALKIEILKASTYVPPATNYSTGEKNPWSKEHFNLTEQGKILTTNPELAKTLMAKI